MRGELPRKISRIKYETQGKETWGKITSLPGKRSPHAAQQHSSSGQKTRQKTRNNLTSTTFMPGNSRSHGRQQESLLEFVILLIFLYIVTATNSIVKMALICISKAHYVLKQKAYYVKFIEKCYFLLMPLISNIHTIFKN